MEAFKQLDTNISYSIFSVYPKTNNFRLLLKSLEWSCHGVPFFAVTIIALYLWPNSEFIAQLLVGLFLDITYIALIKAYARRQRPSYAQQDDQMVIAMDKHSFPSGHASRAIYVALLFNSQSFLSFLIWIWAISVCSSRVFLGRHFITDVFGGIILGYFEFWFQFGIGSGIANSLIWVITTVLGLQFSNTNDFDSENKISVDDLD
ncbi:presqualene diphosphate phosphatase-like protein [Leptotrombidium deliense]|uniref:Presqualene diphosphate phosphatase-like protein n=1 Tax=Leptotrombidium deliense TaxID=299467 RepID=A0A443SMP7_9ACAR|nr:presqualene diphosphate phosphatase-like protein [Leptotrombidium deliense]